MKFFHCPGSCSLGIHILLEEVGAPYEIEVVDLKSGGQFKPEFLSANPKGKVPALIRDNGSLLTEFGAIAFWLGKAHPQAKLIGTSIEDEVRTIELLDYIVGSVHMRGFTFVTVPMKFMKEKAAQEELREFGLKEVSKGLSKLSDLLGDREYLLDGFTIADAALFYLLRFADEKSLPMPDNLRRYFEKLSDRPSVKVALLDFQNSLTG